MFSLAFLGRITNSLPKVYKLLHCESSLSLPLFYMSLAYVSSLLIIAFSPSTFFSILF